MKNATVYLPHHAVRELAPAPIDRHFARARRLRRRYARIAIVLAVLAAGRAESLERLDFAPNPGALAAFLYRPERTQNPAPLVVALHGCAQGAADVDDETGWSALADRLGFILLLPQQPADNNPARCFNWFNSADRARDGGEAESIRHMVEAVRANAAIDPERIFAVGLSAGGGMASALLATHPDLFAGGAVIGAVPYGCAPNLLAALPCMRFGNRLVSSPDGWAQKVRQAAPAGTERWPRLSIWHDAADPVVSPYNARSAVAQWIAVHGIDPAPDLDVRVGPHAHRLYRDTQGQARVEQWITRGVGHATPIDAQSGCGRDDPTRTSDFVTDAGLCASREIARFWGLLDR